MTQSLLFEHMYNRIASNQQSHKQLLVTLDYQNILLSFLNPATKKQTAEYRTMKGEISRKGTKYRNPCQGHVNKPQKVS